MNAKKILLWVSNPTQVWPTQKITKSTDGIYLSEQIKQQARLNKNIETLLGNIEAFGCDEAKVCINDELALAGAWVLNNFWPAVIAAYEEHIAAWGADPEFCGEMLACLQAATPAVVDAVAAILNTALATSPNPILSNLCAYINDCIDSGLLTVSADAGNLITTGTDGGAFIDTATVVAQIPATTNVLSNTALVIESTVDGVSDTTDITADVQALIDASTDVVTNTVAGNTIATHTSVDGTVVNINETITTIAWYEAGADSGVRYTQEGGTNIDVKTNHAEVVTPTANTAGTITHNLGTTRVHAVAYDVAGWDQVEVEFLNRTATSIDYISTTWDSIEIVVQK